MRASAAEETQSGALVLLCAASWAVPGAGHLWLGRRNKGLIFMAALPLMFIIGLALGGRIFPFTWSDPLVALAAVADLGIPPRAATGEAVGGDTGTTESQGQSSDTTGTTTGSDTTGGSATGSTTTDTTGTTDTQSGTQSGTSTTQYGRIYLVLRNWARLRPRLFISSGALQHR